jgi:hypothetical protein
MIYEIRTYDVTPRSLPEVEKRFGESYEKRKAYSPLAASWHTEIGPLNQVIQVWPYKDLQERDRINAAAVKDNAWPPDIGEFVIALRSDIMLPFTFSPEMKPGKMGPYFEMRTYTYQIGGLPLLAGDWERALPGRLKFGPLCGLMHSELGALNKFLHIWPYTSLDQRNQIRDQVKAAGIWPPSALAAKEGRKSAVYVAQENKIVMPSPFSPIQ